MLNFCRVVVLLGCGAAAVTQLAQAQDWIAPTPEELAATSIPEVPGAIGFYLNREETTDDHLRMFSYYTRVKVLTEGGKDLANVEIPFSNYAGVQINAIAGRTIHPDGSIVPFSGKPYEKLLEKGKGYKIKAKIFTMPAVEIGSILEYRYKLHYDDNFFRSPDWFIQTNLFTRKAHYSWRPTNFDNITLTGAHGETLGSIAWTPILPAGAEVKQVALMEHSIVGSNARSEISLDIQNVPPLPHEDAMPPTDSVSYRVLFYYTSYKTMDEYWNKEGKYWSKDIDKFVGPGPAVKEAVKNLVSPGDTPDQKLHKIYAAVQLLENTDFTRQRNQQEERAQGLKESANSDDILTRKRGNGDQITELFVSMVRAAGLKAYVMGVSDRTAHIFLKGYLSTRQLDDLIAIVSIDGKEMTFDPGQRYCPYNRVSWKHSYAGGLRQTDGGVALSATGPTAFRDEHSTRIADLSIDEHGVATGQVTLSYTGDPALYWRQEALRGDDTSLNTDLKANLEQMLPGGMEVRVTKVDGLTDAEKPLQIVYEVKGAVGSPTGKRLLIPGTLFEANEKPRFVKAKRELPIDMHYPSTVQDAVRFKLPQSLVIESSPSAVKEQMAADAAFTTSSKVAPSAITLYRNVSVGRTVFPADQYADLSTFYGKLDVKDHEPLVLVRAESGAKPAGSN